MGRWKAGAALTGLLLILGVVIISGGSAEEAQFDEATVHLSPDCGCCVQHAQYLERAGVQVEVKEHSNEEIQELWNERDVPSNYRSCHLTEIEGEDTDVKGHVPVEIFNNVVEEQPQADLVTLPGMPSGSPGMPGTKSEDWIFYEVESGEVTGEFAVI